MSDELPPMEEEVVERIDLSTLKPLWEPHEHEYIPDPSDQTNDYSAEVCKVEGCGMGRLISK